MPAFEALDHYNSALVLLLGVGTFAGVFGVGFGVVRALRLNLPTPWVEVVAALVGVSTLSLLVQLLGMSRHAGRPALIGLWVGFLLVGSLGIFARLRGFEWGLARPSGPGARLLIGLLVTAAGLNLLLAMAPSTKIDELNYHTLVPARIVLDSGLEYYLRSWGAAIMPQMLYSIAGAPLHALGYPDAPNVVSWCLSMLLAWFAARLVQEQTGSTSFALLAAASTQIGLHPSIYHNTGASHAIGDLAATTAVLAVVFRERLFRSGSAWQYILALSLCCIALGSSKVSFLPLAALILAAGFVLSLRTSPGDWPRMLVAAALPWLVLYLPILVWTFVQSGSPFGPILRDVFAPSVFGDYIEGEIAATRAANQQGLVWSLENYLVHYALIFPLGAAAAFAIRCDDRTRRPLLALFLGIQLAIVVVLLPQVARHLSGLHHALLVVGLIHVHPYAKRWLAGRSAKRWLAGPLPRIAAMAVLLLPWFGVQAYRAFFLVPVAIGLDDREEYYRRYIALYDDFRELDRMLPKDAGLFARSYNMPAIYFPRPYYMDPQDVPPGKRVFALLGTTDVRIEDITCEYMRLPSSCRFGEPIYVNDRARYNVFRTPGREPQVGRLEVREILGLGPGETEPEPHVLGSSNNSDSARPAHSASTAVGAE